MGEIGLRISKEKIRQPHQRAGLTGQEWWSSELFESTYLTENQLPDIRLCRYISELCKPFY